MTKLNTNEIVSGLKKTQNLKPTKICASTVIKNKKTPVLLLLLIFYQNKVREHSLLLVPPGSQLGFSDKQNQSVSDKHNSYKSLLKHPFLHFCFRSAYARVCNMTTTVNSFS